MAKFLVGTALATALLAGAGPAFSQVAPGSQDPSPPPTPGTYPGAPPPTKAQQAPYPAAPAPQQGPTTPYQAAPPPSQPAPYPAAPPPNQAYPYPAAPPGNQTAPYPGSQSSPAPASPYPEYAPSTAPQSANYPPSSAYPPRPVAEPPAAPSEEKPFELPDMSVRVDPLNWLIYGRLGLELEAAVWKFISVELVPVFVTDQQPPFMNLGSFPSNVYQKSNGLGALSGASLGAGFWLNQDPFRGTVFRVLFTNYAYTYETTDDAGRIDIASHTDRRIYGFLGSHSRWGIFTIASGIGLGAELNRQRRCMDTSTFPVVPTTVGCKKDVFDLQLERGANSTYGVYGWLHPAYLDFRLSLGFVF